MNSKERPNLALLLFSTLVLWCFFPCPACRQPRVAGDTVASQSPSPSPGAATAGDTISPLPLHFPRAAAAGDTVSPSPSPSPLPSPSPSPSPAAVAGDTIFPGQPRLGNWTIVSENAYGNVQYVLGFFTPGVSNKYYLSIWTYNSYVEGNIPVWIANRENPISNLSASNLSISNDGNLVLTEFGNLIWSTNSPSPQANNSAIAVLLDSGNLVVRDNGVSPPKVLWQSFDRPTNTWLAGAPLGFDRITGKNMFLTSWRDQDDPSPGMYSLEIDRRGGSHFLLRKNGSNANDRRVWHIGFPNGIDILEDSKRGTFSFDNATALVLDIGRIDVNQWFDYSVAEWNLFWSYFPSADPCYSRCGPFGICERERTGCICPVGFRPARPQHWEENENSDGCMAVTPLNCRDDNSGGGNIAAFHATSSVLKLPDSPQFLTAKDDGECRSICSRTCSCTAYSYSADCHLWYGELYNLIQCINCSNTSQINIRLGIDSPAHKHLKISRAGAFVSIAALGTIIIFTIGLIVAWRKKNGRRVIDPPIYSKSFRVFSYSDLKSATNNFSNKLGQGSFGSVFRGTLLDSTLVAVKKLEGVRQGEKQFRAEVITAGMIQHINIVRLLGFCAEGTRRLLVYEYVPNGSLDSHLFSKTSNILDWNLRYQTAIGIARGLAYLHEKCKDYIIHCDIKPENILLDDHFCPRIADFGMAKLFTRDGSRVLTTMRGTIGYLAPEWISGVAITHKADVYSFGMMLFEIISGRRNTERSEDGTYVYFPTWAAGKINESEVLCLLDHRLKGEANMEELSRACRVACWCIQEFESNRPSMGQVVQMLEGVQEVNMPPIPTFLHNFVCNENGSSNTQVYEH